MGNTPRSSRGRKPTMSGHVEGLNRNQTALFLDTLEGYVGKENLMREMLEKAVARHRYAALPIPCRFFTS